MDMASTQENQKTKGYKVCPSPTKTKPHMSMVHFRVHLFSFAALISGMAYAGSVPQISKFAETEPQTAADLSLPLGLTDSIYFPAFVDAVQLQEASPPSDVAGL